MLKFETPPNKEICFIDKKEIVAVVPYKIICSKILLRGGGEVIVHGKPTNPMQPI